mmetsp:Transcript_40073/g.120805  ORF Transcript_40073/g.120805 Transcript_40073/m.120805 type:complete len:106 (+) Transcript_40073:852-1169(+)
MLSQQYPPPGVHLFTVMNYQQQIWTITKSLSQVARTTRMNPMANLQTSPCQGRRVTLMRRIHAKTKTDNIVEHHNMIIVYRITSMKRLHFKDSGFLVFYSPSNFS